MGLFRRKYRTLNTVRVFRSALIHNLNLYKKLLPDQAICPVLKSNAYGHGLVEVASILEHERPEFFVVDSLYEAYELKKAGIKTKILILGYTYPENLKKNMPFQFTVSDIDTARVFAKLKLPVHLEIDTGFNRMGFSTKNLGENLMEMKEMNLNIIGIFTHFADADNPNSNEYTEKQSKLFQEAIALTKNAGFSPKWIHAGQSAGSLKTNIPELNVARLGISLYGISSLEDADQKKKFHEELKPAMELSSTIINIRKLNAGDKISYGCTYVTEKDMKIGVIPVGYYEAIPRSLSNSGSIQVNGKQCPILGRVCMNHTMIDLTGIDAQIGDEVIVFSKTKADANSLDNLAKKAGTIPYELLVKMAESIRREVI